MKVFTLLAIAALAAVSSGSMFEINYLLRVVPSPADRAELRELARDMDTPRAQIQQQVNVIVARQRPDIQVWNNSFGTNPTILNIHYSLGYILQLISAFTLLRFKGRQKRRLRAMEDALGIETLKT